MNSFLIFWFKQHLGRIWENRNSQINETRNGFDYKTNKVQLCFKNLIQTFWNLKTICRFLQDQAKEVLISACQQAELNKALCYVEKKPGNVYYYYRRKSGEKYLTIMSPKDWGDSCPFEFLGGEFCVLFGVFT